MGESEFKCSEAAAALFRGIGGEFVLAAEELAVKLGNCRALIFDWDGVFNSGRKGQTSQSDFSEADSMGTNMLRYGLWRRLGHVPVTAIISGEQNTGAIRFAEREHFSSVYTGIRDKRRAVEHLCESANLEASEIACVFDDINDLPMAEMCGVRLMVRRATSPLLSHCVIQRALCDYISGSDGGNHAVREICELVLGLMNLFDQVLDSRTTYDSEYQDYFSARQAITTGFLGADADAPDGTAILSAAPQ